MTGTPSTLRTVTVLQGDVQVSSDPNVVLTTILGSCVAACMYDPKAQVGGMNHFLLPGNVGAFSNSSAECYGVHLMELFVNGLLKKGVRRDRLVAKLFGGARTVPGFSDVGARNAECARRFLEMEGITLVGESLGGCAGRRIQFWPTTGRARQFLMPEIDPKTFVPAKAKPIVSGGDVELF